MKRRICFRGSKYVTRRVIFQDGFCFINPHGFAMKYAFSYCRALVVWKPRRSTVCPTAACRAASLDDVLTEPAHVSQWPTAETVPRWPLSQPLYIPLQTEMGRTCTTALHSQNRNATAPSHCPPRERFSNNSESIKQRSVRASSCN